MNVFKKIPRFTIGLANIATRLIRFLLVIGLFYLIYKYLLDEALDGSKQVFPIFALWLFSAYLVLPKIHRTLTKYYLPNYYVGRIRSGSGLLSDPINLAFFGDEKSIKKSMITAGWVEAVALTAPSLASITRAMLLKESFPDAPVGNMYLFNRRQDFAYEVQMKGNPRERHHVRFWKTPDGWRLPGGHKADWLAAATYDKSFGFKAFTWQIDHLISPQIDEERDYILKTLKDAKQINKLEIIEHFTDSYHDHNNGGDRIETDGALPFITLDK